MITKSISEPANTRFPLPSIAIAYFPSPKSAQKSLKIRHDVEANGRVKLKTYPDLGKERVEDRILKAAKKRAALLAKNTSTKISGLRVGKSEEKKKTRTKRMSKKKRLHERKEKTG